MFDACSPVRCESRSRTDTFSVRYGSRKTMDGRYRRTGASHSSFPSSTSMAAAVAVNDLESEAMLNTVCSSTRSGRPSWRTP